MNQYLAQTNKEEVKNWINTTLIAYLRKQPEDQGEIEHIIDFLNSDKAPIRLSKMSYVQAKISAEKWMKTQIKKGNNIIETDADVKVILRSKTSGFTFVRLIGENAFKREGHLMSHCVASYANKEGVNVYSLRDAQNIPHCTIEVVGDDKTQVNQIKGKGNGPIHPDYIKYVIKILKYFKMDVRDSEMSNLGYQTLSKEYWECLDSNFVGLQYISFNGKKYLYGHTKMISKERVSL